MSVYLALDVGKETIGLAAGETDGYRSALYTVCRTTRRRDVAAVVEEVRRRQVTCLVVGLPLLADGREGESARRARRLGELIAAAAGVPVVWQDERLSTCEATERLEARGFRGAKLKDKLDAEAALVILEDYLASRSEPGR